MNAEIASELDVWSTDCALHDLARRPVDEVPVSIADLDEWIATLESLKRRKLAAGEVA